MGFSDEGGDGLPFPNFPDPFGGGAGKLEPTPLPDLPGGSFDPGTLPTITPETGAPKEGGLDAFGKMAKSVMPFAQLGTAGLGIGLGIKGSQQQAEQTKIAKGAEKRQEQIAGQAQQMAQPLSAFSQQQLTQAGQGKIDPAQEALVQNWLAGAKQKVMDFFARSGQGDSLQLKNELAWLDQMADAMRMQAITAEEQTGIAAAGTAGGVLGTGASAAAGAGSQAQQQGGNIQALIAEANKALGVLAGGAV